MHDFEEARQLVIRAVADRVCPAASVEVGHAGGPRWREAFGSLTYEAGAEPTRPGTVFDLASLSKVIATTTIAARLVGTGRLSLDALVGDVIAEWTGAERVTVTVRDLLEHCAGLPAHAPLFDTCRTPAAARSAIAAWPLEYAPRTRSVYSDLGFILLGWILEASTGLSLHALWADVKTACGALEGDAPFAFNPPAAWRPRIAPTRHDDWRGRLLVGEVDDNNAWALGGVAGHAGLFGTAGAVGGVARVWLQALRAPIEARAGAAVPRDVLEEFLRPSAVPGSSRACGWDLMRPASSCGTRMSARAFGHTGFTGTSLWLDPDRDLYVVLLTNRVHPTAGGSEGIQILRRSFHDAVVGTG